MVRLFHASDLHFGHEDRVALDWFAGRVAEDRPDGVVITGDLTMRGSAREYHAARDWLASLGVPLTLCIGNHDVPYYHDMVRRLLKPYARYRALVGALSGSPAGEIDLPGLSVVPLRTVARAQFRLNWSKGVVKPGPLRQVADSISALPRHVVRLVAAHHPLVETGTRGTALTRGGNRALASLAGAGVTAVLSGHVHDPFDMVRDTPAGPVRLIGAGTLSERIRTTPPSFNILSAQGGALDVTVATLA